MILGLCGPRDGPRAFRMKCALIPNRVADDRCWKRGTKQRDRRVRTTCVDQTPRTERPLREAITIGLDRGVIIHASGKVPPVCDRDAALRVGLEVEQIERLGRGPDRRE